MRLCSITRIGNLLLYPMTYADISSSISSGGGGCGGWESIVDIVICYRLDGTAIEIQWKRDLLCHPD